MGYRQADGDPYVAIYGARLEVGVVDMRPPTPRLVRTYDVSSLGSLGMVAIDNTRDEMVLESGPKDEPHTVRTTDMSGRVLHLRTGSQPQHDHGVQPHGGRSARRHRTGRRRE